MARTERGPTGAGHASEMTTGGATAPAAAAGAPHCQPSSQPISQLNNVLDVFMK